MTAKAGYTQIFPLTFTDIYPPDFPNFPIYFLAYWDFGENGLKRQKCQDLGGKGDSGALIGTLAVSRVAIDEPLGCPVTNLRVRSYALRPETSVSAISGALRPIVGLWPARLRRWNLLAVRLRRVAGSFRAAGRSRGPAPGLVREAFYDAARRPGGRSDGSVFRDSSSLTYCCYDFL
jgi:hypothetical protein